MLCDELNVRTIIHGGDIFTSRKGQTQDVLLTWKKILDEAAEQNIKFLAIPGNHDKTNLTKDDSFLHVFHGHSALEVMEAGSALSNNDVDIFFLPYFDEELTYSGKLKEVSQIAAKDRCNILCTHIGIDEAKTNSGIKLGSGVKKEDFERFTYVLVGHYHDRQVFKDGKIIYTGSAYQANFGEDTNKGVVVIYDDTKDPLEFIELDFTKYVTVDVLPEDLNGDLVLQVNQKQNEANVRIRINGDVTDDKKHFILSMQEAGTKVEVEKESFQPLDILQNKKVVMSDDDIITTFEEWAKERGIKDGKYGKKLLQKEI